VEILLLSENDFGFPSNHIRFMRYIHVHVCVVLSQVSGILVAARW